MNASTPSSPSHPDTPAALHTPPHNAPRPQHAPRLLRVALIGNPNTGKTTLFNRLCGLRHKTSNFPGTTLEARLGRLLHDHHATPHDAEIIDLPGIYSLELDQLEATACRRALAGDISLPSQPPRAPDAVCVVVDAANLARNLVLVGEVLRRRLPTLVVVNMIDLLRKTGADLDAHTLEQLLGCRVLLVSARTGEGFDALKSLLAAAIPPHLPPDNAPRPADPAAAESIRHITVPSRTPPGDDDALHAWADDIALAVIHTPAHTAAARTAAPTAATARPSAPHPDTFTDRLDRLLTHPVVGLACFAAVMTALFWLVFRIATVPMGWIEQLFALLAASVESSLPPGILTDLIANGVIAGIGATVVFLPQICLLFFAISILEDTGYLARAAFVLDRFLKPFGLSGHSFVPLLSSHACALPGIMACRAIPDRRARLATILVAPFMSCSARIPVYVLLVGLLFPGSPALQALAFSACYALGVAAGLFSALIARLFITRGPRLPMLLELPSYKLPSLRTAILNAYDRGLIFLKKAGTAILAICIVLWWLSAYPVTPPPQIALDLREQSEALLANDRADDDELAQELADDADHRAAQHHARNSFTGRLGAALEPVFRPLGYDRQLTVAVIASFAAREVFATTMAVIIVGDDEADLEDSRVLSRIAAATRDDAVTPVFTRPTSWSLLVYFVLAMQCLPTLAVTAKEAGSVKWALLQLVWMCGLAYAAAFIVYQLLR